MTTQNNVFIFSGQGSQCVGMGKELCSEFREFAITVEEASDYLGYSVKNLMFVDADNQLGLTEFTQPAIVTMSTGIFRILRERMGAVPSMVTGHSLGEYSALVALGALSFSDALKAVRFRGQAMQKAVPVGVGGMAAYLGTQISQICEICATQFSADELVEPVNFNSPTQLVLSGHKSGIEKITKIIAEKKLGRARILPVSAPFHSSLMKPAALAMQNYFNNITLQKFSGSIVANVDAKIHTSESYSKDMLIKQIASSVLWTQSVEAINGSINNARFIEVGPGQVLQGLIKQIIPNSEPLITGDLAAITATIAKG